MRAAWKSQLAPPPRESVSNWCEGNICLPARSAERAGPIRIDVTPWIREPLDCFSDESIDTITLCFCAQGAKTTAQMCMMAWAVVNDPGPQLYITGNEKMARKFSKTRWKPFVDESPAVAAYKPLRREDYALLEQHFLSCSVMLVGSNSPINLASQPIRYLFPDEPDKYPLATDREAAAVALALKRVRTYTRHKVVLGSTPTTPTGEIWLSLLKSDFRKYFCPCPFCGELQFGTQAQLWWPPGAKDPTTRKWDLERVHAEAGYKCRQCLKIIRDQHKEAMVRAGRWIATQRGEPRHAGFHFPAFFALWESCSFGQLAVDFLKAKGDPDSLRDHVNSTWAEPFKERGEVVEESTVLGRRHGYAEWTCPVVPVRVFLTVDKQKLTYWYILRAWCSDETSYLVSHGQVATLTDVEDLFGEKVKTPSGTVAIDEVFMDSGYSATETYAECRPRRWTPTKGFAGRGHGIKTWKWGKASDHQRLLEINVDAYKKSLHRRIAGDGTDNVRTWYLHDGADEDYALQITAEEELTKRDRYNREKKIWIKKQGTANHLLDCEVMQLAVADAKGIRRISRRRTLPSDFAAAAAVDAKSNGGEWRVDEDAPKAQPFVRGKPVSTRARVPLSRAKPFVGRR